MKITLIGAGTIGSVLTSALLADERVTLVQVCDAKARALQDLQKNVRSPKLRSFQVDARDPSVLEPIIRGSDCVVSSARPDLNLMIAELSLRSGAHFCDLGSSTETVDAMRRFEGEARERGCWIVPNCGLAPGLINILCVHAINQFDSARAAYLRVGDVPLDPEPPFNFRIAWSAEKLIDDYVNPVILIEGGECRESAPLTGEEEISFGGQFEHMEAFHTAGGLATLTSSLAGKIDHLDHKTIRWPGHASQMRFLLGLGFAEPRSVDVRTHLTYRDILARRLAQRLGGHYQDVVLLRVLVNGIVDGQEKSLVYEMIDQYDEVNGRTAIQRCTSFPAATIATMLAAGEIGGGGVNPPEFVVPGEGFRDLLRERGMPITKTWVDGAVRVSEAQVIAAG
jgi:lysine 6-dehydrogenase